MNKKILLVTLCATFVAFVLLGQNQDIRRGGGSGGGGVSVAAGTGITTATNSSVVTVSNSGVLGVAAGSRITTTTNAGVVTVTASAQSAGLFYNGSSSSSAAGYTIQLGDVGKLLVFTYASNDFALNAPDDATAAIPVGGYVYCYFSGIGIGGLVAPSGSAQITRYGSGLNIAGQYAMIKLYKVSANTWHAEGDLTIP